MGHFCRLFKDPVIMKFLFHRLVLEKYENFKKIYDLQNLVTIKMCFF